MESVRKRQHYSKQVREILTKAYKETPYPSEVRLKEIARKIQFPIKVVRRWFYQKRYKTKQLSNKETKKQKQYPSLLKKDENETQTNFSEKTDHVKVDENLIDGLFTSDQKGEKIDTPPGYEWYLILTKFEHIYKVGSPSSQLIRNLAV